jgi:hypothetical protein
MFMFKKKSTWERLTEPVSGAAGQPQVKSGLAAVATAIGVTLASVAVSALRRRSSGSR